ncbi:hypothetical protein CAEBREN_22140 [Caenorhabditis brenneri]|uniref:Uncharacterized protein n=1 Tax=Caenorhabditis brenneri TaxID=135651 RepID=G0ND09_CAEBE|nr:hypothetical protein CAEBREN_22140 [Caenorhabditis brenneri]
MTSAIDNVWNLMEKYEFVGVQLDWGDSLTIKCWTNFFLTIQKTKDLLILCFQPLLYSLLDEKVLNEFFPRQPTKGCISFVFFNSLLINLSTLDD